MGSGRRGVVVAVLAIAGEPIAGASCHSGVFGPSATATCSECPICQGGAGDGGGGTAGAGAVGGAGGSAGQGGDGGQGGGGASCPNDPDEGLVVHLRLDETTGEVRDATRDVTCSPRGAPGYREHGLHGSSVAFAGEDGFDCGDLEPLHDLGALTVAAWIYSDEVPSQGAYQQSHIATKSSNSVEDGGFALYQLEDQVTFIVDAELARREILSNAPLTEGAWTHVAAVYDGERLSMYIDGQLDATKAAAAGVIDGGSAALVAGNSARTDASPFGFQGRIDDVRVYDRALCAEEIGELSARQGWIFYNSTASGMLETWAAHDDGTSPVRLTDNLVGPASARSIWGPRASWDGRRLAIGVQKDPNEVQDDYYLYVARADGSQLHPTVWMGELCQAFGWDALDRLVYAEHVPCEESLYRFDPQSADAPTLIRAGVYEDPNPIYPAPNPADPNDIVVNGIDCTEPSFVRRVDAETGEMTLFPGPMSSRRVYWFEAGDRFAHVAPDAYHDVQVYDLPSGTSSVVNVDANPTAGYSYLAPGNGGARIYALRYDPTPARWDAVAVDLASGAVQTLVTGVDGRGISWAIVPFELDRDGDGLGNGIDPTPEG